MTYSKHFNTKQTPQKQPIPGSNQVQNNAGGYVFNVNDKVLLDRFLTLGSEGGTYYVSEQKPTLDNAKNVVELIKNDGEYVVARIREMVSMNRLVKLDSALFALALAATFGNENTKAYAYNSISEVCITATHLFSFLQYIQDLRGWSRGLRNGVSNWYLTKETDKLVYQLVKYRQRNGWTHRDALRLAHPKAYDYRTNKLFAYAVGKTDAIETGEPLIIASEQAKTASLAEVTQLITKHKLTWEMLPTDLLKEPRIQQALIDNGMPMTALMRNLNRFTNSGVLDPLSSYTKTVVDQLTNKDLLRKARIHPVNVLNALATYKQGYGDRGKLTWTPTNAVVAALEDMFQASFHFLEPTEKKILVAVDVSGSMHVRISNMSLSCSEVAAALATTFLKTEPNVELIYFSDTIKFPKVTKNSSYSEVLKDSNRHGGTDCSLPFRYLIDRQINVDAVVILTDNETWAGDQHPIQAYAHYKKTVNPDVKAVCVAMVANSSGLFPDTDKDALNICGFDSSVPQLVNNFISEK